MQFGDEMRSDRMTGAAQQSAVNAPAVDFDGLAPTDDTVSLARHAYVWGFPLVATARIRVHGTCPEDPYRERPATSTGAPMNRWGSQSRPSDPSFRAGVGPSVDLLYSSLRLDLRGGPFVVEVPDCGERYYTVQIAFADSSAEHSYGRRTHGSQLPPLFITGPDDTRRPPPGMLHVASPTRYCQLPTRFLFDPSDPDDLGKVHDLQARLSVRTYAAYVAGSDSEPPVPSQRPLSPAGVSADDPLAFLHELGAVLRDWHIRPSERHIVDSLAALDLTPERGFCPETMDSGRREALVAGLEQGREAVQDASLRLGTTHNGWTTNLRGPRFGDDILLRAAVAKDQIMVTVPEEALYPLARCDVSGAPLTGDSCYRIDFPADAPPPAEAFWSVTLYDDSGFLVDNPIGRYAVSPRTPGLAVDPDGGFRAMISHVAPTDEGVNWLPAPAGPFYLMMRLYLPGPSALDGSWGPPPIHRVDRG
jgi:hypothetical protein